MAKKTYVIADIPLRLKKVTRGNVNAFLEKWGEFVKSPGEDVFEEYAALVPYVFEPVRATDDIESITAENVEGDVVEEGIADFLPNAMRILNGRVAFST